MFWESLRSCSEVRCLWMIWNHQKWLTLFLYHHRFPSTQNYQIPRAYHNGSGREPPCLVYCYWQSSSQNRLDIWQWSEPDLPPFWRTSFYHHRDQPAVSKLDSNGSVTSQLRIKDLRMSDAGVYHCKATSSAGSVDNKLRLTVEGEEIEKKKYDLWKLHFLESTTTYKAKSSGDIVSLNLTFC